MQNKDLGCARANIDGNNGKRWRIPSADQRRHRTANAVALRDTAFDHHIVELLFLLRQDGGGQADHRADLLRRQDGRDRISDHRARHILGIQKTVFKGTDENAALRGLLRCLRSERENAAGILIHQCNGGLTVYPCGHVRKRDICITKVKTDLRYHAVLLSRKFVVSYIIHDIKSKCKCFFNFCRKHHSLKGLVALRSHALTERGIP